MGLFNKMPLDEEILKELGVFEHDIITDESMIGKLRGEAVSSIDQILERKSNKRWQRNFLRQSMQNALIAGVSYSKLSLHLEAANLLNKSAKVASKLKSKVKYAYLSELCAEAYIDLILLINSGKRDAEIADSAEYRNNSHHFDIVCQRHGRNVIFTNIGYAFLRAAQQNLYLLRIKGSSLDRAKKHLENAKTYLTAAEARLGNVRGLNYFSIEDQYNSLMRQSS